MHIRSACGEPEELGVRPTWCMPPSECTDTCREARPLGRHEQPAKGRAKRDTSGMATHQYCARGRPRGAALAPAKSYFACGASCWSLAAPLSDEQPKAPIAQIPVALSGFCGRTAGCHERIVNQIHERLYVRAGRACWPRAAPHAPGCCPPWPECCLTSGENRRKAWTR